MILVLNAVKDDNFIFPLIWFFCTSIVKDREPVKSTVVGRPILLALEDVDGTPSFLEKALTFIEEHGGFSSSSSFSLSLSLFVCMYAYMYVWEVY